MSAVSGPTLGEVKKWVKDLNDWFSVGVKLGVSFSKLRRLEDKYPTEAEQARTEMITIWLTENKRVSWTRLADAMEYAGQFSLARTIRKTYNCPTPLPQPVPTHTSRRRDAYPKKPSSIRYVVPSSSSRIRPCKFPSHLRQMEMVEKSFSCSCCECPSKLPPKPDPEGALFPYITSFLNSYIKDRYQTMRRLTLETDAITVRFRGFVSRILHSFKSRPVPTSALIECISSYGTYLPTHEQVPLLLHRMDLLKKAISVDEIFLLISDYITYFNHGLISHLIKALGSWDDKDELDNYMQHFNGFGQRSMYETAMFMYGYMWIKNDRLIVLKIEDTNLHMDSFPVSQFPGYLGRIGGVMGVLPHVMLLCYQEIKAAGLMMVVRIPSFVAEDIFPLTKAQEKELGKIGITEVHSADYCFLMPGRFQRKPEDEINPSDFDDMYPPSRKKARKPIVRVVRRRQRLAYNVVLGHVKPCCSYHGRLRRHREVTRTIIRKADMGYDGDSEVSASGSELLPQALPTPPIPSKKRLRWYIAESLLL